MIPPTTRHSLLEKQIRRAARLSGDGTCDLDLLFDAVSCTYAEQETLRLRHDRASKLMADEILESKKFLDLIINRYPGGLFWKNKDQRFVGCNEFVLKLIHLDTLDQIIGKTTAGLGLPGDFVARSEQEEARVLANGEAILESTYRLASVKGQAAFLSVSTIPLFDLKGEVFGTLGVLSDVTEKKRTDEELRRHRDDLQKLVDEKTQDLTIAKEQAEKSNQIKRDFLANMSHELRTPLNSILGIIGMMAENTAVDGEFREMASIVQKSATNLLDIVNDILDISKIEAGSMVLETIGFDFQAVLSNLIEAMAPIASSKGLVLKSTLNTGTLPYVKGDPLRVGRIVTNLVSNAIKYTSAGSVTIEIEHRQLDVSQIELICSVTDTGIGIPADKLAVIFEKFTQADETITRKYGGTGLGLAITKDLVVMMNGTIDVDSRIGGGSCFRFRIPFETTDAVHERGVRERFRGPVSNMDGLRPDEARILIAEDHALNQAFIRKLLGHKGFVHLTIAQDGDEAVEAMRSASYDIVLMDCHMPNMNGYEATAAIRAAEPAGSRTPIVGLTADMMVGTSEKCLAAGMDAYVGKPIEVEEFFYVLSQWIAFPDSTGTPAASAEAPQEVVIDLTLLSDYADTPEELKELTDLFLSQAEVDIGVMRGGRTDGENVRWSGAAHRLKSGAATCGAKWMHRLCEQAQNMTVATAAERTEMLRRIEDAFVKVHQELDAHFSEDSMQREVPRDERRGGRGLA